MLKSVSAAASLVVCSTCRMSKAARDDSTGNPGGQIFEALLSDALSRHRCRDRVEIQRMPCLFACSAHCTVFIRSERRLGYILGGFAPLPSHAGALLDYVAAYLDTDDGVVPYARWPEGVKGHFLVRVPPAGYVWEPPA